MNQTTNACWSPQSRQQQQPPAEARLRSCHCKTWAPDCPVLRTVWPGAASLCRKDHKRVLWGPPGTDLLFSGSDLGESLLNLETVIYND